MSSPQRLLVGILGNARSGKTHSWNLLFGHEVRTGKNIRRLYFNDKEYVDVFLVSRSPGKRRQPPARILHGLQPRIVLCSLQYRASLKTSLDFFRRNDYAMYLQWLNPGYADRNDAPLFLELDMISGMLSQSSVIAVRNGKEEATERVEELLDFIYGWAHRRNLVKKRRTISKPPAAAPA
ncbi:MAG TPA: hypothetical protein P5550_04445 [Bacteroidales bacterium]|nr:hypothetical protein [Bacteroidales bacterium]